MAEFARQNVSSTEAFMGLEAPLSRSMSKEICLRKALHSSSVLAAQKRQLEEEDATDPDKLAEVSSKYEKRVGPFKCLDQRDDALRMS